jgi:pilus assembly protein Flp/PilA
LRLANYNISRVAEPVRLLHRLRSAQAAGFEPLVRLGLSDFFMVAPGRASSHQNRSSPEGKRFQYGGTNTFKVRKGLAGDNFRARLYKLPRWHGPMNVAMYATIHLVEGFSPMLKYYIKTTEALKRLRTENEGVVSFEYVIVAACIVAAVIFAFGSGTTGAIATALSGAIGKIITAINGITA